MVDEQVVGWLRRRTALVDAVTAGALALGCVLIGVLVDAGPDYFVFTVALSAPLAVRRRWPEWSAVAVAVAAGAQWVAVRETTGAVVADVAVPIAVYTLAAHGRRSASLLGLVAGLGGAVLGGWSWPQLPMPVLAHLLVGAFLAGTVLAAWLGGAWQRARRGELAALAERAALRETAHEQRVQLAVLSERTRIARDIHDILAHALSVIIAQADGGRYAARARPQQAVDALGAIGKHAREALGETRRAIGVLREDPIAGVDPAPAPGIADLGTLVDDRRAAGLPVELAVDLTGVEPGPGVGLLVYRIVQEALTNVAEHAGAGARAFVSVRCEPGGLLVGVADDGGGTGAAVPSSGSNHESGSRRAGFGLAGMRERVSAHGGVLEFGRRDAGPGHLLRARIPVGNR